MDSNIKHLKQLGITSACDHVGAFVDRLIKDDRKSISEFFKDNHITTFDELKSTTHSFQLSDDLLADSYKLKEGNVSSGSDSDDSDDSDTETSYASDVNFYNTIKRSIRKKTGTSHRRNDDSVYCIGALQLRSHREHANDFIKHMLYAKYLHDHKLLDTDDADHDDAVTSTSKTKMRGGSKQMTNILAKLTAVEEMNTDLRSEQVSLKKKLTKSHNSVNSLKQQLIDMERKMSTIDDANNDIITEHEAHTQTCKDVIKDLQNSIAKANQKNTALTKQITKIKNTNADLTIRIDDMAALNTILQKQVAQLIDESSQMRATIANLCAHSATTTVHNQSQIAVNGDAIVPMVDD